MPTALYHDVKTGAITDYVFVERETGKDGGAALLTGAELARSQGKRLLGLFGGAGGNFEPPVPQDSPGSPVVFQATMENPLLKEATVAALRVLSKDEHGFFLMVEQGDIDWANHANDYRWMIGTTWDLNEAVKAAIRYVDRSGDDLHWGNTLLIVTSDHANSYMRLSKGKELGKGDLPTQLPKPADYSCPPGAHCGNYLYPDGEVTYRTGHHTNELVRLYAFGEGKHLFGQYEGEWYPCTEIMDNTQVFHVMAEAVGAPQAPRLRAVEGDPARCPGGPHHPGRMMRKVLPIPGKLSTSTRPP